jgi:RNA polymerase-binding transcription factor DksA
MKQITQGDIEELRIALEAEKDSLEEELASHGRIQGETGDWQGSSAGFEGEEADPLDVADQIEELATNVPLVEELETRHKDVEEALEKIEHGTYGMCEEGGEEIPLARLEANPAARTCVAHAR